MKYLINLFIVTLLISGCGVNVECGSDVANKYNLISNNLKASATIVGQGYREESNTVAVPYWNGFRTAYTYRLDKNKVPINLEQEKKLLRANLVKYKNYLKVAERTRKQCINNGKETFRLISPMAPIQMAENVLN